MDIYFSFSRTLSCSATNILRALSTCISIGAEPSPSQRDAKRLKLSGKEPAVPELLEHPVQIPKSLKVKWMLSIAVFLAFAPYILVGFFLLCLSYSTI